MPLIDAAASVGAERFVLDDGWFRHRRFDNAGLGKLVLAGDGSHARSAAQPTALYRLLERILDVCPKLEIETCASGGTRVDLAILEHAGRVWTSDNIDPIERASIQQGFLRFMPPETMGAHVGHQTAHRTGRVTSLHTRAIVALQGQFGFELDARKLNAHDVITLQRFTQLYKKNRDWLDNSCYWQLTTYSKTLIACGYVDNTQDHAMFSVVAIGNMHPNRPGHLPMMDRQFCAAGHGLRLAGNQMRQISAHLRYYCALTLAD